MKIAYLLNSYPMTSTTFIRREIEAIEAAGQPIKRFAVRRWNDRLVDPDDIAEQEKTEYLLSGNVLRLLGTALIEAVGRPAKLANGVSLCFHYYHAAGAGAVRHIGYFIQALRFRRRARILGIDHVHAHFSTNAAAVSAIAHSLGGPTFSFTVHGPDELVNPPGNAINRKIRDSAFVVAITSYCKSRLVAEAPDYMDKIKIIKCGINLSDYEAIEDLNGTFNIVCVGRLCANKAQALIPKAFSKLAQEFPGVTVELLGDGEDREVIEQEISAYGLQGRVRLTGWATAQEVREKIRSSSVLILPSLAEGLPIVLMEALAMTRPVLTTNIAGIPELVDEQCGWLITPGSVPELESGFRAILTADREVLRRKGLEGRRRVEMMHNVNDSARNLIVAIRDVNMRS